MIFFSGKFYLYYNLASQGFWAVGEKLGSEVVRLENQGDRFCPYYLKSLWRYADGDLNALVYDTSLRTVCMNDVCSVARCGHQVCFDKKKSFKMFGAIKITFFRPNVSFKIQSLETIPRRVQRLDVNVEKAIKVTLTQGAFQYLRKTNSANAIV